MRNVVFHTTTPADQLKDGDLIKFVISFPQHVKKSEAIKYVQEHKEMFPLDYTIVEFEENQSSPILACEEFYRVRGGAAGQAPKASKSASPFGAENDDESDDSGL